MRVLGACTEAAVTVLAVLALAPPSTATELPVEGRLVTASASGNGGVVVNEFVPTDPGSQIKEFVELRNTSDQAVALHGWELLACRSPGTWQVAKEFGPDAEIDSGGYLLLAHPDYDDVDSPPPDHFYDVELQEDGGWLLVDPWSGYADAVGLSAGLDCTDRGPAPKCDWAAGEAVTRDGQAKDTDDNAADFTCLLRTPGR